MYFSSCVHVHACYRLALSYTSTRTGRCCWRTVAPRWDKVFTRRWFKWRLARSRSLRVSFTSAKRRRSPFQTLPPPPQAAAPTSTEWQSWSVFKCTCVVKRCSQYNVHVHEYILYNMYINDILHVYLIIHLPECLPCSSRETEAIQRGEAWWKVARLGGGCVLRPSQSVVNRILSVRALLLRSFKYFKSFRSFPCTIFTYF